MQTNPAGFGRSVTFVTRKRTGERGAQLARTTTEMYEGLRMREDGGGLHLHPTPPRHVIYGTGRTGREGCDDVIIFLCIGERRSLYEHQALH